MFRLDITMVPHAATIVDGLNAFSGDLRSVREALERAVDQVVRPSIEANFETQGQRIGGWQPLAASTIVRRVAEGYGPGPILTASGTLRRVAQQKNIWTFDGQRGEAFVHALPERAFYGVFHQLGSDRMTSRPFIMLTVRDEQRIEEVFYDWLSERAMARLG